MCILDVSFEVEKAKKKKKKILRHSGSQTVHWGAPSHHSKLRYTQNELLACGRSVST